MFATMEARAPMLNCLLQNTLKSLCSCSNSSKWVYAVFWRILPRNYPPPKWEYGGGALDRSKGSKRNWILVWEDGFCDVLECGIGCTKERFGAHTFFKMSHEVYNYGDGLVGKVSADNSHKWVFRDPPNETDPNFTPSWNVTIEPPPKAWELQFNSGIQTIAIISVREGLIQLGSFDKVVEDLHLVISIQRKLSYLQSIPRVLAIERPYIHNAKRQARGAKRFVNPSPEESPLKSINLGWNSPQNGAPWANPPLMSCSLGALLSKLPPVYQVPDYDALVDNGQKVSVKVEALCHSEAAQEDKPKFCNGL